MNTLAADWDRRSSVARAWLARLAWCALSVLSFQATGAAGVGETGVATGHGEITTVGWDLPVSQMMPTFISSQADIGSVGKPGRAVLEITNLSYRVAGGGENMWFTNDAFHFVWDRRSGNFSLSAAVEWLTAGGNAHRKACLIARQGLDPDSPYVDVAVHGDGLISLQYRELPGGPTREVQANLLLSGQEGRPGNAGGPTTFPVRVGLQRQGDVFFLTVPATRAVTAPAGAAATGRFETGWRLHPRQTGRPALCRLRCVRPR